MVLILILKTINIDKNIMQYTLGPTNPNGEKIKEREFKELTPNPR